MSAEVATPDVTDDLFFGGRLRLRQPKRGHRFGGDAALLTAAAWSRLTPGAVIVDLGAGVGTVGLALAALGAGRAMMVEIDPPLAALAEENARRNGLGGRVEVFAQDVAATGQGRGGPAAGSAGLVVMNPPFDLAARFRASLDADKARAHMDDGDVIGVWVAAAERLLAPGGTLVLIHRWDALDALLAALAGGFGDVRVLAVHARAGASASRALLAATKGAGGALAFKPPLVMHGADDRFTAEADAAQRGLAMLDLA